MNHHGHHGREATRGLIDGLNHKHPVLNSVVDVFGPTDVYGINSLTGDSEVLLHGQVLVGMNPWDVPRPGKPLMPLAWVKHYKGETGNTSRVFATTMGASVDMLSEGLRRILVNAVFWGLEMDVPGRANVDIVGEFKPTMYGFGTHKRGVFPADHAMPGSK